MDKRREIYFLRPLWLRQGALWKISPSSLTIFTSILWIFYFFLLPAFAQFKMPTEGLLYFKNQTATELREFIFSSGWTSSIRSLSPAHPLGALGWDVGLEVTTIPQNAFPFDSGSSLYFPRLSFSKGLTQNLDLDASIFTTEVLSQATIPKMFQRLWLYGGGLKYTVLHESDFWVSIAGRATYTRLDLLFLQSDILGADVSLSRKVKVPYLPITLTPYVGAGYLSSISKFDQRRIPFLPGEKQKPVQGYRYFTGLSFKVLFADFTVVADFSSLPKKLESYSFKMSVDI